MNANTIKPKRMTLRLSILTAVALMFLYNVEAASKNKGGKGGGGSGTQSTPIEICFDAWNIAYPIPNVLVSDGINGNCYSDSTGDIGGAEIREGDIALNLAKHHRRAPIRNFALNGGFPFVDQFCNDPEIVGCVPIGVDCVTNLEPDFGEDTQGITIIPWAQFQILGREHTGTGVGVTRSVNARVAFSDFNGDTWSIFFGTGAWPQGPFDPSHYSPCGSCMAIQRLPNTDPNGVETDQAGTSHWEFWTEEPHVGYLYLSGQFAGVVEFPISGTIMSLTDLTAPSGEDYVLPNSPQDCP